jgi:rubrerythrin
LPPDDLLTGDLTTPHWRVMSGGRIQVESKDDIRKRLGRSTDDGDAVVMAMWPQSGGWAEAYGVIRCAHCDQPYLTEPNPDRCPHCHREQPADD